MTRKKVLITGASRGLGLAIAKRIYQEYDLILHAKREDSFTEIPPNSQLLCADFSDKEQVANFCKELKKHGDTLYGIINNAGVTFDKPLTFQPERDIDMMLQVNLRTPMIICKTAMKIFGLNKKGVIINVSSVVGETGNAFQSIYAATKAGLVALSKSLAKEVGMLNNDHEIRVLSVSPGFISSDMTDKIPEADKEKYLRMIPSQRFGKTEEIAETITFLLSEKASYINGSNININGGLF